MLKWHGDKRLREIRTHVWGNVKRAAITLQNEVKRVLSRAGRGGKLTSDGLSRLRRSGIKNRSVKMRFGKNRRKPLGLMVHSRPGEPPRRQDGTLRMRISREFLENEMIARVGTNYKIARYLEHGTHGGRIIRAKSARVLANVQTGQVFGKRVRQGAIKPRPFLKPTFQRMKPQLERMIGRRLV